MNKNVQSHGGGAPSGDGVEGCSAIVEMFGLKDLATDDPVKFEQGVANFYKDVRELLGAYPDVNLIHNTDYCLFITPKGPDLLSLLDRLRTKLLARGIVFRAVVAPKETKPTVSKDQKKDMGLCLDKNGCELRGRVEQFKGLGIQIDSKYFDHPSFDKTGRDEWRVRIFRNCYFPSSSQDGHVDYDDLAIDPKATEPANTDRLVNMVRENCHHSVKMARFFIPFLINWARNMDFSKRRDALSPKNRFAGRGLDYYITDRRLGCLNNVTGHALVYAALINRLYPKPTNFETAGVNKERWRMMHDFLVNNSRRLLAEIRDDDKGTRIRDFILRRASRRAFHLEVAQHRPPPLPAKEKERKQDRKEGR